MKTLPIILLLTLFQTLAHAQDGPIFFAVEACEVTTGLKNAKNPGDVRLTEGEIYEVLQLNLPQASHAFIRVPEAKRKKNRWVPVQCGVLENHEALLAPPEPSLVPQNLKLKEGRLADGQWALNVLALSQQAAFCETRPRNRECGLQKGRLFGQGFFSLHGLWPQGAKRNTQYCQVSGRIKQLDENKRYKDLPRTRVDRNVRDAMLAIMPAFTGNLDEHEWVKHGSCYHRSADQNAYFSESAIATGLVNELAAINTLRKASGSSQKFTIQILRALFEKDLGVDLDGRFDAICDQDPDSGRTMLLEIRMQLFGDIKADASLAQLAVNSRPTLRPSGKTCRGTFTIDGAGNQR